MRGGLQRRGERPPYIGLNGGGLKAPLSLLKSPFLLLQLKLQRHVDGPPPGLASRATVASR